MNELYKLYILPLVKHLIDEFVASGFGEYEQPLGIFYEWLRNRSHKDQS